jgi:hypothetical protein
MTLPARIARARGDGATMARLRSDFWVSAYLRQRSLHNVPAVLRRRGAEQAGAIFIKVDRLDGGARLYGPAPPSLDDDAGSRRFALILEADTATIEERIAREQRFDSDLWLIEVDDRSGDPGLDP